MISLITLIILVYAKGKGYIKEADTGMMVLTLGIDITILFFLHHLVF